MRRWRGLRREICGGLEVEVAAAPDDSSSSSSMMMMSVHCSPTWTVIEGVARDFILRDELHVTASIQGVAVSFVPLSLN